MHLIHKLQGSDDKWMGELVDTSSHCRKVGEWEYLNEIWKPHRMEQKSQGVGVDSERTSEDQQMKYKATDRSAAHLISETKEMTDESFNISEGNPENVDSYISSSTEENQRCEPYPEPEPSPYQLEFEQFVE